LKKATTTVTAAMIRMAEDCFCYGKYTDAFIFTPHDMLPNICQWLPRARAPPSFKPRRLEIF
jgi:hypothetical protein